MYTILVHDQREFTVQLSSVFTHSANRGLSCDLRSKCSLHDDQSVCHATNQAGHGNHAGDVLVIPKGDYYDKDYCNRTLYRSRIYYIGELKGETG